MYVCKSHNLILKSFAQVLEMKFPDPFGEGLHQSALKVLRNNYHTLSITLKWCKFPSNTFFRFLSFLSFSAGRVALVTADGGAGDSRVGLATYNNINQGFSV